MKFLTPFSSNWRVVSTVEDTRKPEAQACFWELLGAMWFYSAWLGCDEKGEAFRYRATKISLPLSAHMGLYAFRLGNMQARLREEMACSFKEDEVCIEELKYRLTTLLSKSGGFAFEFFFGGFEHAAIYSREFAGSTVVSKVVEDFAIQRRESDFLGATSIKVQQRTIELACKIFMVVREELFAAQAIEFAQPHAARHELERLEV